MYYLLVEKNRNVFFLLLLDNTGIIKIVFIGFITQDSLPTARWIIILKLTANMYNITTSLWSLIANFNAMVSRIQSM
jgi:hypothetical protein